MRVGGLRIEAIGFEKLAANSYQLTAKDLSG